MSAQTPDYERGYADGFADGVQDGGPDLLQAARDAIACCDANQNPADAIEAMRVIIAKGEVE